MYGFSQFLLCELPCLEGFDFSNWIQSPFISITWYMKKSTKNAWYSDVILHKWEKLVFSKKIKKIGSQLNSRAK